MIAPLRFSAMSAAPILPAQRQDVQFAGLFKRNAEKTGNKIYFDKDGQRHVPDTVEIPVIAGDGIGHEITKASQAVVDEAIRLAYGGKRQIQWLPVIAGEQSLAAGNPDLIPPETKQAIDEHFVAVKGPLNTPTGKGFRSINVQLRALYDLFANIRPVKSLPEVATPTSHREIDTVIFRENTEDVYKGIEFEKGSQDALDLIAFLKTKGFELPLDTGIGIKPISETASKRIITQAIQYALDHGKPSVTVVHKGNIQKFTEGAFWQYAREVAAEQFPGRVITQDDFWSQYNGDEKQLPEGVVVLKDRIADAMLQDVILNPKQHHVVVTTNLNGDYLSDAFAALVGGLGLAPGANIGDRYAIFEAVHGTAPDIAGQNKANPTALMMSMRLMLEHLGWGEAAGLLQGAIDQTLFDHRMTGDLARHIPGTKALSTDEYTDAVLSHLRTLHASQSKGIIGWVKKTLLGQKAA